MRTVVFIPTCRLGGLDIIESSLARQDNRNFEVLIADDYFYDREFEWYEMEDRLGVFIEPGPGPKKKKGHKRNLAAAYNEAARYCIAVHADVFISLQDYIWIPETGVSKFAEFLYNNKDSIITGLTSISGDPAPSKMKVHSWLEKPQDFHYSIFEQPYMDKPTRIEWQDVRGSEIYPAEDAIIPCEPWHWESNWAGVSVDVFRAGIFWDEDFDRGIAYENVDFAMQVSSAGGRIFLDPKNHAVSLPHKDYFGGEREEIIEFSNREFFEEKWGFKT